jgi:hypothetical protein
VQQAPRPMRIEALEAQETTACVLRHIGQLVVFCHRPGMSRAVQASRQRTVRGPKRGLAQSGQLLGSRYDTAPVRTSAGAFMRCRSRA